MAIQDSKTQSKIKLVDINAANTSKEVPVMDLNAPIKFGQEVAGQAVPTTDINAPINIEKVTKNADIPESNLNAALKIDQQKPVIDKDAYKISKKLLILGVLIVVAILAGIGGFIFLQNRV